MEELTELITMNGIIRGIEVDHQFFWDTLLGSHADEKVHQRVLQLADPGNNLLVTAFGPGSRWGEFQPIQRTLTRQWLPLVVGIESVGSRDVLASAEKCQQRVTPQSVMIIEIFVPESQPHDALQKKFLDREFNQFLISMVGKTSGKLSHNPKPLLNFAEQKTSRIGSDHSPIEIRDNFSTRMRLKKKPLSCTHCHDETALSSCKMLCGNYTLRENGCLVYLAL